MGRGKSRPIPNVLRFYMPVGYHHKNTDSCGTYYFNEKDKRHRTDGPAYEGNDGTKQWYVNGERHRTDGPAIEYADGAKEWYVNGELHRTDGPAVEYRNGTKYWYVNGELLTEQEFNKLYPPKRS